MTDYKNTENQKGLFVEWKVLDWFYFIIALIVFGGFSRFLTQYLGLSKDWTLAIFLIPIAIFAYLQNKRKKKT